MNLALSPLAIAAAIRMLSYVRVFLHALTELAHLDSIVRIQCKISICSYIGGKSNICILIF